MLASADTGILSWQASAQHALQFAFRTLSTPIIKISSINSMRGASGYGNMTPQERHGQAAMILACVQRALDVSEMAYVRAHYGRELQHGENERAVADTLMRAVIGSLGTGAHNRRGVEKLIRVFFGQDISMVSIRYDLGCNSYHANKQRNCVYDALGALGMRADNDADIVLRGAGLVR